MLRRPQDTYARIAPRSGLAWKHFIDTGAGVVDYDYRGNVGVILFNHGEKDFEVKKGDPSLSSSSSASPRRRLRRSRTWTPRTGVRAVSDPPAVSSPSSERGGRL